MFSLSTLHNSWNTLAQLLAAFKDNTGGAGVTPVPLAFPSIYYPHSYPRAESPGPWALSLTMLGQLTARGDHADNDGCRGAGALHQDCHQNPHHQSCHWVGQDGIVLEDITSHLPCRTQASIILGPSEPLP